MGENTLTLQRAKLNGSGVVKTADGRIRTDDIIDEQEAETATAVEQKPADEPAKDS